MKSFNLAAMIIQLVCGLVCIALGIYYCFAGTSAQIVIFLLVGGGCIFNAVRLYLQHRKGDK